MKHDSLKTEEKEKQLFKLHLAFDIIDVVKKVDTDRAFKKVKYRMERKKRIWKYLERAAAVLFIPLLSLVIIEQFDEKEENFIISSMVTVKATRGMISSLYLPDSTFVCLNSGSSLSYPSRFDGDVREVYLEGEGFFEVKKDEKKNFLVKLPYGVGVQVHGTTFNVVAYPEEAEVDAMLLEGKVEFVYKEGANRRSLMMQPGQRVVYDTQYAKTRIEKADLECATSWRKGVLMFRKTPFKEVLKALSRRFGVQFSIQNPVLTEYAFSGSIEQQPLESTLNYIEISSDLRFLYSKERGLYEVY